MSLHRVVIVGKEPEVQQLARQFGTEVFAADDLTEASDTVQALNPDLILIDHHFSPNSIQEFLSNIDKKKRRIINLTSYNYLGLSTPPEVIEAAKNTMDKYGLGSSGAKQALFLTLPLLPAAGYLYLLISFYLRAGGKPDELSVANGFERFFSVAVVIYVSIEVIYPVLHRHCGLYQTDGNGLSTTVFGVGLSSDKQIVLLLVVGLVPQEGSGCKKRVLLRYKTDIDLLDLSCGMLIGDVYRPGPLQDKAGTKGLAAAGRNRGTKVLYDGLFARADNDKTTQ